MFDCSGNLDELMSSEGRRNIQWDNGAQAIVDDHGPMPQFRRIQGEVLWAVEAEPASCTRIPKLKPRIEVATAERRSRSLRRCMHPEADWVTWLVTAGIVAMCALVTMATVVWFEKRDGRYDRALTEQEERLKREERSGGPGSAGAS